MKHDVNHDSIRLPRDGMKARGMWFQTSGNKVKAGREGMILLKSEHFVEKPPLDRVPQPSVTVEEDFEEHSVQQGPSLLLVEPGRPAGKIVDVGDGGLCIPASGLVNVTPDHEEIPLTALGGESHIEALERLVLLIPGEALWAAAGFMDTLLRCEDET
ncbi:MAG: hypothetical protein ACOYB2_19545, partial [Limnohabitans sp.]